MIIVIIIPILGEKESFWGLLCACLGLFSAKNSLRGQKKKDL